MAESRTPSWYFGMALLTLAAFVAGVAGASMVLRDVVATLSPQGAVSPTKPAAVPVDHEKVTAAVRQTVGFYRRHTGTTPLETALLPADHLGNGVIITSDGWILTSAALLSSKEILVAVTPDRRILAVNAQQAVKDEATGLALVRVEADDLSVAQFGDDTVLVFGDELFDVSEASIGSDAVVQARAFTPASKNDLVETTEKLPRYLLLQSSNLLPGTPVVNTTGEVVGVAISGSTAVPISFVSGIFKNVFSSGSVGRPKAGIKYLSLDLLIGHVSNTPKTGALVTSVVKGSAAESAGVLAGDVITGVERDKVGVENTLSEIISEYMPGAEVKLHLLRAGEEKEIFLTLK